MVSLSSVMYTSKLFLSPVYFLGLILCLYFFLIIISRKVIYGHVVVYLALIFWFYSLFFLSWTSHPAAYINLFLGLSFFIICLSEGDNLPLPLIKRIVYFYILFTVFLLFCDSLWRITHAGPPSDDIDIDSYVYEGSKKWFYIYKYNSLMFTDSNSTGLIIISTLMLQFQTLKYKLKFKNILLFLSILILLSTIARSAFIAIIFGVLILKVRRKYIIYLVPFLLTASFFFILYFSEDGSLNNKVKVIDYIQEFITSSDITQILFGVGLGNSTELLHITPHILFVEYFFGGGVFGLLCFFLFIILLYFYLSDFSSKVLLVSMVAALSYYTYGGTPFLFVPIALSYLLESKESKESSTY
jgi:hypothetical protein